MYMNLQIESKMVEMVNNIYNEDCLDTMSRMSGGYVDLILASPPYDDMRKYSGRQCLNNTEYNFEFKKK
jgi:DNA modification methylase